MTEPAVEVSDLRHAYGDRVALDGVSLSVPPGEIFALLGPNGSGKTTLFRILSTMLPAPPGSVRVAGFDPAKDPTGVRSHIGVVFQSPSLDKQLTAEENLVHQGHLFGLRGPELRRRVGDALEAVGMAGRARERTATFSGGMRRRVEVAKALLHRPRVLLMDEPSTGLDPAARIEMWRHLRQVTSSVGVAVLLTTHLMEEADGADRLAVMERGRLIACDTPAALKDRIGGDVISMVSRDPAALAEALRDRLGLAAEVVDGSVRIERERGHELVVRLIEAAPGLVESVSVGKPTLQDVFIRLTGKSFETGNAAPQGARGHAAASVR